MKFGVVPQNLLERFALAANLAPTPLADTLVGMWLARTVMVGTRLGLFEALAEDKLCADEVAQRCGLDTFGATKLLNALVGSHYLRLDEAGRYSLAPLSRRWLLKESKYSLHDSMLSMFWQWELIEHYEEFVRTGRPYNMHEDLPEETWGIYQRYMRANAGLSATEVARRSPLSRGASTLLDIGGSHGLYSVALCRRHKGLRATVLDLPEAISHAASLLAREGMGDRVKHQVGDALTYDLGVATYDLVLLSNLMHHFDPATNHALTERVATALRPGGTMIILELIRATSPQEAGQVGALGDLYFSALSEAGTYSYAEMAGWQSEAGLFPKKGVNLLTLPGHGLQIARKGQSGGKLPLTFGRRRVFL